MNDIVLTYLLLAGMGVCVATFVWITFHLKEHVVDEVHGMHSSRAQAGHALLMAAVAMAFFALATSLAGHVLTRIIRDAVITSGVLA